ncbi:MAG: hypothetical protein LBT46_04455 [Planctomycetaceae bacterium]|nr:hypothetical protein [Planctomycetaceae bacterium]
MFVGDKLSDLNKQQAEQLNVKWVELRADGGYKRFAEVLTQLGIPHKRLDGNLASALDKILDKTAANDDNRGTSFF